MQYIIEDVYIKTGKHAAAIRVIRMNRCCYRITLRISGTDTIVYDSFVCSSEAKARRCFNLFRARATRKCNQ